MSAELLKTATLPILSRRAPFYADIVGDNQAAGYAITMLENRLPWALANLVSCFLRTDPRIVTVLFEHQPCAAAHDDLFILVICIAKQDDGLTYEISLAAYEHAFLGDEAPDDSVALGRFLATLYTSLVSESELWTHFRDHDCMTRTLSKNVADNLNLTHLIRPVIIKLVDLVYRRAAVENLELCSEQCPFPNFFGQNPEL